MPIHRTIGEAAFSSGHDQAYAIAIDSLGRIVMAGKTPGEDSDPADLALLRFTDDGEQDDQFGPCAVGDGMIVESYGSLYEYYDAVVIDADDRVIVGGYGNAESCASGGFGLSRRRTGVCFWTGFTGLTG